MPELSVDMGTLIVPPTPATQQQNYQICFAHHLYIIGIRFTMNLYSIFKKQQIFVCDSVFYTFNSAFIAVNGHFNKHH